MNIAVELQKLGLEYQEKVRALKDPDAPSRDWSLCGACKSTGHELDRNGNPGRFVCGVCHGVGRVRPEVVAPAPTASPKG